MEERRISGVTERLSVIESTLSRIEIAINADLNAQAAKMERLDNWIRANQSSIVEMRAYLKIVAGVGGVLGGLVATVVSHFIG